MKKNIRGINVPEVGDDIIKGLELMGASIGTILTVASRDAAKIILTQAQNAGTPVTSDNPMFFEIGGAIWKGTGTTLRPVGYNDPPLGQVVNSNAIPISSEHQWRHIGVFNGEPLGRNGLGLNSSGRFVIEKGGVYELTASGQFSYEAGTSGWRGIAFSVNGAKAGPDNFIRPDDPEWGVYLHAAPYYVHLSPGSEAGLMAYYTGQTMVSFYNYMFTCRYVRPVRGDADFLEATY